MRTGAQRADEGVSDQTTTHRYDFSPVADPAVAAGHPLLDGTPAAARRIASAVGDLLELDGPRHRRLWAYYENPSRVEPPVSDDARPYRQAQEWGLPARITGVEPGAEPFDDLPATALRKEVVIENDIGWRVDTTVDFLLGRGFVLDSAAPDPERATLIATVLRAILAANGGLPFLQRIALVGAVYGSADLLVKARADGDPPSLATCSTASFGGVAGDAAGDLDAMALAGAVCIELVEPARALPIVDTTDGQSVLAYAQVWSTPRPANPPVEPAPGRADWIRRVWNAAAPGAADDASDLHVEVIGPRGWQRWKNGQLIDFGHNSLGEIPLAHVQNGVRPLERIGASDVEPLIPLQDELNTRLSDRAHRVVLQSQRMYLGVGIDGFGEEPIRPGRMWATDNLEARIETFGSDTGSAAEADAIREVRQALDKTSGVNPAASGAIGGRVGNLSSAAALRLTFQALLAKTERKRANYGAAISRCCELALGWLHAAGLFETEPEERRVRLTWPDPVPVDEGERLDQARQKQLLGVDPDVVRRELGY